MHFLNNPQVHISNLVHTFHFQLIQSSKELSEKYQCTDIGWFTLPGNQFKTLVWHLEHPHDDVSVTSVTFSL